MLGGGVFLDMFMLIMLGNELIQNILNLLSYTGH